MAIGDGPLVQALADLDPVLLTDEYVIHAYPRGSAPATPDAVAGEELGARIDDPLETTLILRRALAEQLPGPALRHGPLRAILLQNELAPDLTGFVSVIAGAFAERNMPIITVGTATRFHLLVATSHWPEALAVLRGLRDASRRLTGDG
jgi:hypothetical protein